MAQILAKMLNNLTKQKSFEQKDMGLVSENEQIMSSSENDDPENKKKVVSLLREAHDEFLNYSAKNLDKYLARYMVKGEASAANAKARLSTEGSDAGIDRRTKEKVAKLLEGILARLEKSNR